MSFQVLQQSQAQMTNLNMQLLQKLSNFLKQLGQVGQECIPLMSQTVRQKYKDHIVFVQGLKSRAQAILCSSLIRSQQKVSENEEARIQCNQKNEEVRNLLELLQVKDRDICYRMQFPSRAPEVKQEIQQFLRKVPTITNKQLFLRENSLRIKLQQILSQRSRLRQAKKVNKTPSKTKLNKYTSNRISNKMEQNNLSRIPKKSLQFIHYVSDKIKQLDEEEEQMRKKIQMFSVVLKCLNQEGTQLKEIYAQRV